MLTLVATVRGMVRWLGTKMGRDGKGWEMMSEVKKKDGWTAAFDVDKKKHAVNRVTGLGYPEVAGHPGHTHSSSPGAWKYNVERGNNSVDRFVLEKWKAVVKSQEYAKNGKVDEIKLAQEVKPSVLPRVWAAQLNKVDAIGVNFSSFIPADAKAGESLIKVQMLPTLASGLESVNDDFANYPYQSLELMVSRAAAMGNVVLWKEAMNFFTIDKLSAIFIFQILLNANILWSFACSPANGFFSNPNVGVFWIIKIKATIFI